MPACLRRLRAARCSALGHEVTAVLVALSALLAGCSGAASIQRTSPVWTATASLTAGAGVADGDWPTFDYDPARSGVNPRETAITPATVGRLQRLWTSQLPEAADSTPILLHDLALADGTHRDVLYLTTQRGTLVALDAATGTQLWSVRSSGPKITNSSPVADASRADVYSYGLEGRLHKYSATSGAEVTGNGWPVTITTMTQTEKQGSALNAANGLVYATTGGYVGDAPPYQGHVVAIDPAHGAVGVFNSLCSDLTHVLQRGECPDDLSGVWARAGVVVDPVNGNLFVTTGNGPFTADQGGHDWGDSVLELSSDAAHLIDSYTPNNQADLAQRDADLGSAMPALLPPIPGSHTPYLAVQAGKDGVLRLLDRQNLSGQGGPGHVGGELQTIAAPGGCNVLTQPAVWTDAQGTVWLFVANGCATSAYQVTTSAQGNSTLRHAWNIGQGGTSPVVAGGVLFAATGGAIFALDPRTGHEL